MGAVVAGADAGITAEGCTAYAAYGALAAHAGFALAAGHATGTAVGDVNVGVNASTAAFGGAGDAFQSAERIGTHLTIWAGRPTATTVVRIAFKVDA